MFGGGVLSRRKNIIYWHGGELRFVRSLKEKQKMKGDYVAVDLLPLFFRIALVNDFFLKLGRSNTLDPWFSKKLEHQ